jgi:hypothetical protein
LIAKSQRKSNAASVEKLPTDLIAPRTLALANSGFQDQGKELSNNPDLMFE